MVCIGVCLGELGDSISIINHVINRAFLVDVQSVVLFLSICIGRRGGDLLLPPLPPLMSKATCETTGSKGKHVHCVAPGMSLLHSHHHKIHVQPWVLYWMSLEDEPLTWSVGHRT